MALDIWVVSAGGMITMGLNAVATVMQNSGWKSLVWIAELLGVLTCIFAYVRSHDLRVMFAWGLTFTLVTALLLTPKVTVVVNDLTRPEDIGRVDNVPLGLAAPLWLVTGMGNTLATTYDDIFHFPDERAYTKTGMLFASKLMQDSFTIASRDPVLTANLVEYTKNCVIPDVNLNHKYSFQDVMESEDVQAVIFSNPSPLRGIFWRDTGGSTFMYCRDAAPKLKSLLTTESSSTGTTFLTHAVRMLPGNSAPQTAYADQLAGSYSYFFDSSKSAQAIMLQNIAVAGMRRGLNSYIKGMNDTASMVDMASEQSLMKLRLSHAVSYTIATEVLPQLHTVLLLFGVCIFPIMMLALYVRELTWSVVRSYLNFMGSLMLWPAMFAIFNFAVNYSTQGSFNAAGPTLSNMNRLMETSSTTAGIAGWLMLSIPFLAFRLFTGLGAGFASLSSSLGSALSSASASDSAAVASGNLSAGNVQVDNINGFKTDLNRVFRAGMNTTQLANGATETQTAGGQTVYDASAAISRLPVDLHLDRNLASAAQKLTRDSMSQTETAAQGYSHSVQETGSRLRQFHDQFGNSDTQSLSTATGLSVNEAERVNRMQHVAEDYANRNHISLSQAYSELQDKARYESANIGARVQGGVDTSKSLWGKAGQWVTGASGKFDVHAGADVTARTGATSNTTDGGQSAQDNSHTLSAREATDFSQGMDTLRSYSVTHNGQHVDNNAAGLMDQISAGITTSDSKYAQFTASQSHTHELQRMASETETLSAGAKENYTQQFVQWVKAKSPDEAQTVLTDAASPEVSQRRDALVQEFMEERLRGGVDAHYAQSAAGTGEGMAAPANVAGVQSGGAYDSVSAEIDGRVADSHIRTDVKKGVDEMPGVVKNKAEDAGHEMEQGNRITQGGIKERKGDLDDATETFGENHIAAEQNQSSVLPGGYKDYLEKAKK